MARSGTRFVPPFRPTPASVGFLGGLRQSPVSVPVGAALPSGRGGMSGAGPGPVAQGLKEALVETLNGILCPVQGVRAAAEEQVKVLEVTEGECGGAAAGGGAGRRGPLPALSASCS